MERKRSFVRHIVILSVVLTLVDLSTMVECAKRFPRKRISTRRSKPEETTIIPIFDVLQGSRREQETMNTTACALSLVERYSEVCELVWNINQLEELLPNLHTMLRRRLGGRKFTFTIHMRKSSSTVEMLENAGKALLNSIGKFIKFLGYVQQLFASTVGGQVFEDGNQRRALNPDVESSPFYKEISRINTLDEEEIYNLVQKAWSRKCALDLFKSDKNLCELIERIHTLDGLLKSPFLANGAKEVEMLTIKLNSEKLNLTDFLEAIADGLEAKIPFDSSSDIVTGRVNHDTQAVMIGNKRTLVNEKGEKVEEVFETADYKVELINDEPKVEAAVVRHEIPSAERRLRFFDDDDDNDDDGDGDFDSDDDDDDDDDDSDSDVDDGDDDDDSDSEESLARIRKEEHVPSSRTNPRFREILQKEEPKKISEEVQGELRIDSDYDYVYSDENERSIVPTPKESSPIDAKLRRLKQYHDLLQKTRKHRRHVLY